MALIDPLVIRFFKESDAPQLLELMRSLARFEGYIDEFEVQEADIIKYGTGDKRKFFALVAHSLKQDDLLGMAVLYEQPWTYDMRPTIVLKELYVDAKARGQGVGKRLMNSVIAYAKLCAASRISWTVLHDNANAEKFYRRLGGDHDYRWNNWIIRLADQ